MRKYFLMVVFALSLVMVSAPALVLAGGCCTKKAACDCAKEGCMVDGKCVCKGDCCVKDGCKCAGENCCANGARACKGDCCTKDGCKCVEKGCSSKCDCQKK